MYQKKTHQCIIPPGEAVLWLDGVITVSVLPHVTTLLVLSLAHQVTARLTALFLPRRVKHCVAQKPNTALDPSKRSWIATGATVFWLLHLVETFNFKMVCLQMQYYCEWCILLVLTHNGVGLDCAQVLQIPTVVPLTWRRQIQILKYGCD